MIYAELREWLVGFAFRFGIVPMCAAIFAAGVAAGMLVGSRRGT